MKTKIIGAVLIGYGLDTRSITWFATGVLLIAIVELGRLLENLPR